MDSSVAGREVTAPAQSLGHLPAALAGQGRCAPTPSRLEAFPSSRKVDEVPAAFGPVVEVNQGLVLVDDHDIHPPVIVQVAHRCQGRRTPRTWDSLSTPPRPILVVTSSNRPSPGCAAEHRGPSSGRSGRRAAPARDKDVGDLLVTAFESQQPRQCAKTGKRPDTGTVRKARSRVCSAGVKRPWLIRRPPSDSTAATKLGSPGVTCSQAVIAASGWPASSSHWPSRCRTSPSRGQRRERPSRFLRAAGSRPRDIASRTCPSSIRKRWRSSLLTDHDRRRGRDPEQTDHPDDPQEGPSTGKQAHASDPERCASGVLPSPLDSKELGKALKRPLLTAQVCRPL